MSSIVSFIPTKTASRAALVPVLPVRGQIDPVLDRMVSDLARDRTALDTELRNALYIAYFSRLRRMLIRLWYRNLNEFGCELDDLEQELFLIFDSLLERWSGQGSLSAYLHGAVPWRLFDAARRLAPRDRQLGDRPVAASNQLFSHSDVELVVLLDELAARLSPFDRKLLLWQVSPGNSLAGFAKLHGISERTTRRAWLRLRRQLHRELTA